MKLYATYSCFILYETYRNTNFSNCKIKWKKIFYFDRLSLRYQAYRQVVQECSGLRMKTLERCQWCHSSVFIVNRERISSFVLIVELEWENVCWIHIEMKNILGDKIGCITRYVAVFSVWTKCSNIQHFNIYHYNPAGESVKKFSAVYFKQWFWLKYAAHIQNYLL